MHALGRKLVSQWLSALVARTTSILYELNSEFYAIYRAFRHSFLKHFDDRLSSSFQLAFP